MLPSFLFKPGASSSSRSESNRTRGIEQGSESQQSSSPSPPSTSLRLQERFARLSREHDSPDSAAVPARSSLSFSLLSSSVPSLDLPSSTLSDDEEHQSPNGENNLVLDDSEEENGHLTGSSNRSTASSRLSSSSSSSSSPSRVGTVVTTPRLARFPASLTTTKSTPSTYTLINQALEIVDLDLDSFLHSIEDYESCPDCGYNCERDCQLGLYRR